MHSYIGAFRRYADFQGRASRAEYWYFMLFNLLIGLSLSGSEMVIGLSSDVPSGSYFSLGSLSDLYDVLAFLPSTAICVRRLHDTGRSGWAALLPIANLFFWAEDSQPGSNVYGPNPKDVSRERLMDRDWKDGRHWSEED